MHSLNMAKTVANALRLTRIDDIKSKAIDVVNTCIRCHIMETSYTKYHPTEILQIIRANYRQQQQYDDIVLKDQEFTFDTTIADWQDICDLVATYELWNYLNYYFRLNLDKESWMTVLEPEDTKTLGDLCNFISSHADKEIIKPIKLFGSNCETAAIFKSLTAKLKDRGVDISDIRPSSQLEPLVKKYKSILIEEINQIDPTVLPPVKYKTNWVYKWGLRTFMTLLFVTFFLAYKESRWAWLTGGICLVGYIMIWIGARLNPKQASFTDMDTVADLVRRINTAPNIGIAASGAGR
jgi:hypothetical protein